MSASSPSDSPRPTVDEDTFICRSTDIAIARFFAASAPSARVHVGGLTHPGKVRPNNEDHFVIARRRRYRDVLMTNLPPDAVPQAEDNAYALVVADGMGGAAFGDFASTLVLRTGMDLGLQEIKWTLKVTEEEIVDLKEKLALTIRLIDKTLFEYADRDRRYEGMGSTLTGIYSVGSDAIVVHVGDSRAYLYRNNALTRLTRDHTAAQQLIDAGVIDADSDRARRLSFLLTNCLGGAERGAEPDIHHFGLLDGDAVLLCTDGLTDVVTDDEIRTELERQADPNAACQALIDLALERGGPDNVTVLVGRYEFPVDPEEYDGYDNASTIAVP